MKFKEIYLECTKTEARRNIILKLNRPKTATELAQELDYDSTPPVSKLLKILGKAGGVECLTPERHKDRQYYLTDQGLKIRKILMGEEKFKPE